MQSRARSRLRRWLLASSMLAGGLWLSGQFRRVVAAPRVVESAYQPSVEPTAPPAPDSGAPPVILPGPFLQPSTASSPAREATENTWFEIGRSVQDAPIRALRLGSGPVRLALMGSIHGGWERNTERLVLTAYEHFLARPADIPSALSLFFVPTTNPDGLALGNGPDAAWNARGVDLNRNFDTPNWSPDAFGRPGGRYGPSGTRQGAGGTAPFSEPETRVIRDFVVRHKVGVVISYHSGIVSVSARDGGGGIGEPLAKEMAAITGYPYIAVWTEYKLTGQFMDWLDAVGVKGIEVDLPNQQTIDWEKNLSAIQAVMATVAAGGR